MSVASPALASGSGLQAHTLLPWPLPMSDIKASSIPVGLSSLALTIGPKLKKCDCSSDSAPEDQHDKRAHIEPRKPTKTSMSAVGCLSPVHPKSDNGVQPKTGGSKTVLAATHNSDQPKLELMNPPSSPVKGDTDPNDRAVVEASESTGDYDRDSIVGVIEEDADHGDDESDSDSDSWESTADSSPESAAGDNCLMCLDTEEAAVKSAHKKFHKRCSPPAVQLSRDFGGTLSCSG